MLKTKFNIRNKSFILLLGIIIFLSIFFIAFNNIQTHESDLEQKIEKLELKNEAMIKQADAAKDEQNQRLSVERQLYEKTKKELNQRIREEKDIHQKENNEAQLRFNSLQQQYKILSTKHDDLEQQCTEAKKSLATENDELKRKLDHVKAQLSKTITSKDNDVAMWKVKYENEVTEKDKLQKLLNNNGVASENEDEHQQLLHLKYKNYQLEQDIKDLKQKLHINNNNNNNVNDEHRQASKESHLIDKSFQEQIPVSDDHYKIPINIVNIRNKSNMVKEVSLNTGGDKSIINSVENFQILPQPIVENQNVLQIPVLNGKSTTTTTTTPTSIINRENLAEPNKKGSALTTKSSKKLPKFVLPIPDLKNDEAVHEPSKENVNKDDESRKQLELDDSLNNKQQNEEINENENGAHEINDNNDFNIEEKNPRNHFDTLDQDRNMINNAAEEFDAHNKPIEKKALGNEEMDLEIIRPQNMIKDKLKDEIKNDHGKEDYQEEDLHIEQQEDDLGDIGEYDVRDTNALKNGVAERN